MAKTTARSNKRWIVRGAVAAVALFSFMFFSGGCSKQESSSEKAGREAREAYEKSKELLKEGMQKSGEVAKDGVEKSQEAAKAFSKGWNEGGKK